MTALLQQVQQQQQLLAHQRLQLSQQQQQIQLMQQQQQQQYLQNIESLEPLESLLSSLRQPPPQQVGWLNDEEQLIQPGHGEVMYQVSTNHLEAILYHLHPSNVLTLTDLHNHWRTRV